MPDIPEVDKSPAEVNEYKDRYLRALADYANMKKRLEKEILSAREAGKIELIKELLPVVDTFSAAASTVSGEGMELAIIQLQDTFAKIGLKEINPIGQAFTHDSHECIGIQPGDETQKGTVYKVGLPGYEFNGIVIRDPKVIVYG